MKSELPDISRELIERATAYADSSVRHTRTGFFLTGSNAGTVACELFAAAIAVGENPQSILVEAANAYTQQKDEERGLYWHNANCWATVATELRMVARMYGYDPTEVSA